MRELAGLLESKIMEFKDPDLWDVLYAKEQAIKAELKELSAQY